MPGQCPAASRWTRSTYRWRTGRQYTVSLIPARLFLSCYSIWITNVNDLWWIINCHFRINAVYSDADSLFLVQENAWNEEVSHREYLLRFVEINCQMVTHVHAHEENTALKYFLILWRNLSTQNCCSTPLKFINTVPSFFICILRLYVTLLRLLQLYWDSVCVCVCARAFMCTHVICACMGVYSSISSQHILHFFSQHISKRGKMYTFVFTLWNTSPAF